MTSPTGVLAGLRFIRFEVREGFVADEFGTPTEALDSILLYLENTVGAQLDRALGTEAASH